MVLRNQKMKAEYLLELLQVIYNSFINRFKGIYYSKNSLLRINAAQHSLLGFVFENPFYQLVQHVIMRFFLCFIFV